MRLNTLNPAPILVAALLFCIAPAAHSEMYKWVNEDDTTTFSNEPPADRSAVREFTVVEEAPPVARVITQPVELERQQPAAESATAKRESEAAARAAAVRSKLPPAVQDPCLTSSDRYCHQKHSAQYRPYVGYAPSEQSVAETNQAIVPPPRGASSAAGGSGSVGGGSRAAAAARADQPK